MSQANSRRLSTVGASRRRKLKTILSNRTIHKPLRYCQTSKLSQSANAFWHRNCKSKEKLTGKKQQRNNSEIRSNHLQTLRKSITKRFKRNKKKLTARSVIRKRTNINLIKHRNSTDDEMKISFDQPLSTQDDSQHSNRLVSQDNSYENNEDHTLESTISLSRLEQQNINATDRSIQGTSQSTINDLNSSRKTKRSTTNLRKKRSKAIRKTSNRRNINSSKRKKQKRTSKRKTTLSKKNLISTSKRKNSKGPLSRARSTKPSQRKTYGRSPFPNPNMFQSIPPLQDSDKITEDNVHANHLCCKPITSVKGLSIHDQKKLIEHDYLTLISLLPIYLGSQGNFPHKIREKTNISNDGAFELDRLMNEWSSARLFIGANSHYKTLTQRI